MTPAFSIVTVARNHPAGLRRTHASLAAQRCRDFEWLVQDGGSDDGTAALLNDLADPPAVTESVADDGPYDGMNRAMARASGDYLLFLNAGDALAEVDVLTGLAALIDAPGARRRPALLYGDTFERHDGVWRLRRARSVTWAALGMIAHHQAILYRRDLLAGLNYPADFRIAADYAFTLAVLRRAGGASGTVRVPFAICRFEGNGLSHRQAALGRHEQSAIRRVQLGWPGWACVGLAGLQAAAWTVRQRAPGLYARLRFRHGAAPGDGDHPVIDRPRHGEPEAGGAVEKAEP